MTDPTPTIAPAPARPAPGTDARLLAEDPWPPLEREPSPWPAVVASVAICMIAAGGALVMAWVIP